MAIDRVVLLDENTSNRIAAGEVVERPASAVKELVENAIDAGATQIVVALEEGGRKRLVVRDNGCGMTRNDAILALQRHATSKIRTADDLFAISTLGFRGEALPSIASVSRFTLTTKPRDQEEGTRLFVSGGDLEEVEVVAARDGTIIEIEELFFNTPARLKFLKSIPTEVGRAVDVAGQLAVAHPEIAFQVRSNDQEILSTPGTSEPLAPLAALWGREVAKKLIPISFGDGGLRVRGHVATPDISRPGRSHELFYVNGRPIRSRLLSHALEDAFRSLTPDSRYPIAAVFVEIEPGLVDVNVHPTKTEVKFTRDGEVHHAVSQAVKSALLEYGIVPNARLAVNTGPAFSPQPTLGSSPVSMPAQTFWERSETRSLGGGGLLDAAVDAAVVTSVDGDLDPFAERQRPKPFAEQLREFRVLAQARDTYIIALTPDGIAVVDQHVAHERVLYERLTIARSTHGIPVQRLAVPTTLTLSRREAVILAEHRETFAEAGWEIEPFGGEDFVIRAIPALLKHKPYERILRDMADELINQSVSRRLLVQRDHVTITNACKMAVKAGDPLTIDEMEALLEQLAQTENPYLCPHGRPIVVTLSFREIDRQFKRA